MAETGHGGKAEAAGHGACYGGRQAIRRIHSFTRASVRASRPLGARWRRALTDILTVVWRPLREVRSWICSVSSFGMPHGPVVAVGAG